MTDYRKLRVQEMNRLSVEAFRSSDKTPLIAILDNVRSQHNVGAVFRTADAFRLAGVWLCGICCTPPNDEIPKTDLFGDLQQADDAPAITVLVGPEGDFSVDEVRLAMANGYRSISLGQSRLRTETAALAAVMMMQLRMRIQDQ